MVRAEEPTIRLPRIIPIVDDAPALVLAGITIVGAALRVFHLGFKSLWLDEAVVFWNANGNLGYILASNAHSNSAPPLFPVLLRFAIAIGSSEVALRALPCVAGIAAIPAMYWLAREYRSRPDALMASALVAIAPQMVRYSQQVREYSLAFLLAVLLLGAFSRFVRTASPRWAAVLAGLMVVAIVTQYGLALLILSLNIVFLVHLVRGELDRRALAQWVVINAAGLIAVGAVYELSLKQQFVAGGFAGSEYLASGYWNHTIGSLGRLAVRNTAGIVEFALPGGLTIFACVLGIVAALRSGDRPHGVLLLVTPFVVTFCAALARAFPYIGERQTIFIAPMIFVFVAWGVTGFWRLTRDAAVAGIFLLLVVGPALNYTGGYLRSTAPENIRPIVQTVLATAQPSDGVYVYYGAEPAFRYYARNSARSWVGGAYSPGTMDGHRRQLDALLAGPQPWWLVFSHADVAEMQMILADVGRRKTLELVRQDEEAWLYRAQ